MPASVIRAVGEGFRRVTPYITSERVLELSDFMKHNFGTEQTFPTIGGEGGYHLEMRIGDTMLMIGAGGSYQGPGHLTALPVYVPDVGRRLRPRRHSGSNTRGAPARSAIR